MKHTLVIAVVVLLFWSCQNTTSQQEQEEETIEHANHDANTSSKAPKKKSKSPHTSAMGNVGENHIHIEYSSPSVRGRQIWGGLVSYGEIWVTGANQATSIKFSNDVIIGGVEIASGKYALFTIPGENEWTVIINKNWEQHLGDDYSQEEDIVRLSVVPEENEFVESLKYSVVSSDETKGYIHFEWEKLIIAIEVVNN